MQRILRLYRERFAGWNVRHFYRFAQRDQAVTLSYSFVKLAWQEAGLVPVSWSRHVFASQSERFKVRRPLANPGPYINFGRRRRWPRLRLRRVPVTIQAHCVRVGHSGSAQQGTSHRQKTGQP